MVQSLLCKGSSFVCPPFNLVRRVFEVAQNKYTNKTSIFQQTKSKQLHHSFLKSYESNVRGVKQVIK